MRDADGKVAPSSSTRTPATPNAPSPKATPAFCAAGRASGGLDGPSVNNNAQGEYYLTDVIAMAVSDGLVAPPNSPDPMEVQGANDRKQLAELERHYRCAKAAA